MRAERAVHGRVVRFCAGMTVSFCLLAAAGDASSQETEDPGGERRPVLLLVLTASGGEVAERERRMFSELELALDDFAIETVPSGDPEFARLPMSEQLSRVQPFVDRSGAVATTWVEETGSGTVLLHLVALTTGRALVRIVQASEGPDTEAELALSVRELLGEAYMFGPTPESPAMEQVVAEVQEKVAPAVVTIPVPPAPPPEEPPAPPPTLGLAPFGVVSGGIWGHEGPHIRAGGGIVVEWPPGAALFGRASFVFAKGPDAQVHDGLIVGFGVAPGLTLGYRWRRGPIGVGPLLSVSAPYSSVTMVLGKGDDQTFDWWSFRATAGLELAVSVADDVSLFVDGAFGVQAVRQVFERASDRDPPVMSTPFVEWEMVLGLMVFIG